GLLTGAVAAPIDVDSLDEDSLLAELGVGITDQSDITILRHVRPHAEIKAAEEIANRTPCADFDRFKPLFEQAGSGLKNGTWMTKPFSKDASIEVGDFFIVGGQIAYVAEMQDGTKTKDGRE